jgi:hypothetical protein
VTHVDKTELHTSSNTCTIQSTNAIYKDIKEERRDNGIENEIFREVVNQDLSLDF